MDTDIQPTQPRRSKRLASELGMHKMEVDNTLSTENEHQTPKTGAGDSNFANQQQPVHNQTVVLESEPHGKYTVEKASEAQGDEGFATLVQSGTENKVECAITQSTHDTARNNTTENSHQADESCKLVSQGGMSTTELLQTFVTMHTDTLKELGKITNRLTLLEAQQSGIANNQPVCENVVNRTPVTHTSVQQNDMRVHHNDTSSNSESEGDTDVDNCPDNQQFVGRSRRSVSSGSRCKLPPFNGKEKLEVWHNRFEDVANRRGWSEEDKLDELLPRLQGTAGDFVFSQLSVRIRSSYRRLIRELGNRFKHVEIAKTYQAQFSKRNQKVNESVEDYAVELKRLYDKGHSNRPPAIRQEDLLRRFLDGLLDHKAKQQVEFVKQPQSIEEAVTEVVTFLESSRRTKVDMDRKTAFMVRPCESDDDDDDDDNVNEKGRLARLPDKNNKEQHRSRNTQNDATVNTELNKIKEQLAQITQQQKQLISNVQQAKASHNQGVFQHDNGSGRAWSGFPRGRGRLAHFPVRQNAGQVVSNQQHNSGACYTCGAMGHFSRNCPGSQQTGQSMQHRGFANGYQNNKRSLGATTGTQNTQVQPLNPPSVSVANTTSQGIPTQRPVSTFPGTPRVLEN